MELKLPYATAMLIAVASVIAQAAPNPQKTATKHLIAQSKAHVKTLRATYKDARTELFEAIGVLEQALKTNTDVASATNTMFGAILAFQSTTQDASDTCLQAIAFSARAELLLVPGATNVPREFALGQKGTIDTLRRTVFTERVKHYALVGKRLTTFASRAASAGTPVAIHIEPSNELSDTTVDLAPVQPVTMYHQPIAIDAFFAIAGTVYVFGTGSNVGSPVNVYVSATAADGSTQNTTHAAVLAPSRFYVGIPVAAGSSVLMWTEDVEPFVESHVAFLMP